MNTAVTQSHYSEPAHQLQSARLGMWAFISSELLFFSPMFFGYLVIRFNYPSGFTVAARHTDFIAGTINTAVLLTSSYLMALANHHAGKGAARQAFRLLLSAVSLGTLFLVVKLYEYRQDWQAHLVPGADFQFESIHRHMAELFYYLYFCMTGLHAVHLLIGIFAVSFIAWRVKKDIVQSRHAVEIAALYWHFVDGVWVFLYPMFYLLGRNG